MTREEAIQMLDNIKHEEAGRAIGKDGFYAELMGYHVQALEMAIQALSQEPCDECRNKRTSFCGNCNEYDEFEPCEDAISREAVLEQIKSWLNYELRVMTNPLYYLKKRLKELPSVQPSRKGHWIKRDDLANVLYYQCSECEEIELRDDNFCPNCGAEMESEE